MSPWKQKEIIDLALGSADRNGFCFDQHHQYGDKICLFTKGANEHGFANGIVLQTFMSWEEANAFFIGWEKCELAKAIRKVKK